MVNISFHRFSAKIGAFGSLLALKKFCSTQKNSLVDLIAKIFLNGAFCAVLGALRRKYVSFFGASSAKSKPFFSLSHPPWAGHRPLFDPCLTNTEDKESRKCNIEFWSKELGD